MISLLLADDHTLLREGLKRLLHQTSDILVEGEAGNGQEVLALLARRHWNVLVLDMSMPGRDGIDLIRQIKTEYPGVPILVLTMHGEQQYATRAIKAGASGYLTKDGAAEELVQAVRKVAMGGRFLSQALAESIAFDGRGDGGDSPHLLLSDREFTVFQLLAEGQNNAEIARRLFISVKTVSTYKTRLFLKMHMRNQADLVRYAISHHLLNDPGPLDSHPAQPNTGN
ncbi:response regulator [Castellaniella ginsengisoli]|jgi:DNA-binding NarL/FixJ family response regulator|uniref:Response regulator transcription factor n=1 Tax=Castellaniella denitrificans TaxID=56119 RepID=A0ABT4M4P6_9BURK|nr:response regulator transcription factor [Castellaniella denitrificans]MCZ4330271.1 response regulator transcription factor [Castellaniella denitrificans]